MEPIFPPCAQIENDEHFTYEYDEHLTPVTTRTVRRQFTPGFRADVVRRIEGGESVTKISNELKLDKSNVYRWIENKRTLFLNENHNSHRVVQNAKSCKWPRLETELKQYVDKRREKGLSVSKRDLQKEALKLSTTCIDDIEDREKFQASMTWVKKFMIRKRISIRVPTKVSQQKKADPLDRSKLVNYLARLRFFLSTYSILANILNADETPMWFDMVGSKTLDFIGTKTVSLVTTGHDKTRFTVLLTIAANGNFLKAYVVFKGLKKAPNCEIPSNVVVNVNESGTMDRHLMLDYFYSA